MQAIKAKPQQGALDTIYAKDLPAIFAAQRQEFKSAMPKELKTIVLFGSAWLGQNVAERLKFLALGYELIFTDNNPDAPGNVMGIPLLRPAAAFEKYADSALFVVTIFNGNAVLDQLAAAGVKHVTTYVALLRNFPEPSLPLYSFEKPEIMIEEEALVREAYELLADAESREEFVAILDWHSQERHQYLPALHHGRETYFAPDIVHLSKHERFVDCGAYDGDTVRFILQRTGEDFDRIAAFEPILSNYERFKKFRTLLPNAIGDKIDVYPYATADKKQTLRFSANETASSTNYGEQVTEVQAIALDEELAGYHPTYIKMDIEGSEIDALHGAAKILKEDAPKLAICLYHNIEHLWQVPLLINKLNPGYKLYIRRYASDCWETVCYAIPA